jgi:hypothetical protein
MKATFLKDGRENFEAMDEGRDSDIVEAERHVERLKVVGLYLYKS